MTKPKAAKDAKPKLAGKAVAAPKKKAARLATAERDFRVVLLHEIQTDPNQPRRHWDRSPAGVEDITSTLKVENGVAEPIHPPQVRVLPAGAPRMFKSWMILVGERRCYAAEVKGAKSIRVEVVTIDESEVRAHQLAENISRSGLSPLDTADAVRHLVHTEKRKAEDVAARIGSTPSLVRKLSAVAGLCQEGRAAFDRGCALEVCVSLTLISDAERQRQAAVEVCGDGDRKPALDSRAALIHLRSAYHLRLAGAPFDVGDATLPGGPCAECPKNSAMKPTLFKGEDGVGEDARCTDPGCWKTKVSTTEEPPAAVRAAAGGTGATGAEDKPKRGRKASTPAAPHVATEPSTQSEEKPRTEFSDKARSSARDIIESIAEARAVFAADDWTLLKAEVADHMARRP